MATKSSVSKKNNTNLLAFEEARESIVRLSALKAFLTPADAETLSILMDKKLTRDLRQSLAEQKKRKVSSLQSII